MEGICMQMILICGRARVGKSTVADLIAKQVFAQGQIPKLLSFAGPIKRDAERKGYSKEENPDKYREYCQEIGNGMRQEDPDYWIKMFDGDVKQVVAEEAACIEEGGKFWEHVIIVDDCRYINEVAYGKLMDAVLLFIDNGDRPIQDEDAEWRSHPSEFMNDSLASGNDPLISIFTDIIYNEGSYADLKKIIKANTPIWSGYELDCEDACICEICLPESSLKNMPKLQEIMDELMDLLFLDDLDKEDEDDDEEDPDYSDY